MRKTVILSYLGYFSGNRNHWDRN